MPGVVSAGAFTGGAGSVALIGTVGVAVSTADDSPTVADDSSTVAGVQAGADVGTGDVLGPADVSTGGDVALEE